MVTMSTPMRIGETMFMNADMLKRRLYWVGEMPMSLERVSTILYPLDLLLQSNRKEGRHISIVEQDTGTVRIPCRPRVLER